MLSKHTCADLPELSGSAIYVTLVAVLQRSSSVWGAHYYQKSERAGSSCGGARRIGRWRACSVGVMCHVRV